MKKITISALLAASFISSNAMADDKINPWKHCGIGAIIFDDNGTAAAISNIIWDLGTTAVSSKISSADTCEGKNVVAAKFIQDNFDRVLEETSQGQGEHLTAMLEMLEVNTANQPQVITAIRTKMANQLANGQPTAQSYYSSVMASI
ncbi:DUF3015 family protein [Gayadomonas joobiniege]|uniref:DUF3015 family protein n=1 Tax=Gayadomonas joobiniege TaxID=1234606 RepID=UPI00036DD4FC|nr:DUF3015 family protein [Gayadomonas joobiniege]